MPQFVNRSGGQPCKKVLASVDRLHLDLWDLPNVSCSLFHISSNCEHLADVMLRKCHCYDEDVFCRQRGICLIDACTSSATYYRLVPSKLSTQSVTKKQLAERRVNSVRRLKSFWEDRPWMDKPNPTYLCAFFRPCIIYLSIIE